MKHFDTTRMIYFAIYSKNSFTSEYVITFLINKKVVNSVVTNY